MTPNKFHILYNDVVVFHHAYIGLLLLGWQYPINFIGALVLLDDLYEHLIDYSSPLRVIFDKYIVPRL
jgi:hypothetical protein